MFVIDGIFDSLFDTHIIFFDIGHWTNVWLKNSNLLLTLLTSLVNGVMNIGGGLDWMATPSGPLMRKVMTFGRQVKKNVSESDDVVLDRLLGYYGHLEHCFFKNLGFFL
jgi:hypothetical protein